ncbi:MAG: Rap1a/Tai family immunity protein [Halioglobus sp.]
MQKVLAVLALVVSLAYSGQAMSQWAGDGNRLLKSCESWEAGSSDVGWGLCSGTVSALADVFNETTYRFRVCYPEGVTSGQLARVTLKWLRENPASLHNGANELVWSSHIAAFSLAVDGVCPGD